MSFPPDSAFTGRFGVDPQSASWAHFPSNNQQSSRLHGIFQEKVDRSLGADTTDSRKIRKRTGKPCEFPNRLHALLCRAEEDGNNDIVSWRPHGMSFQIKDKSKFLKNIIPVYFQHTKFSSFQRQLHLYGFSRVEQRGPDHKSYYHELFQRDRPALVEFMTRIKDRGRFTTGAKEIPKWLNSTAAIEPAVQIPQASTAESRLSGGDPGTALPVGQEPMSMDKFLADVDLSSVEDFDTTGTNNADSPEDLAVSFRVTAQLIRDTEGILEMVEANRDTGLPPNL